MPLWPELPRVKTAMALIVRQHSALRKQLPCLPGLDSLDPADAPGVSNIEPGYPGIRIGEAVRVLQGLRGLNVSAPTPSA